MENSRVAVTHGAKTKTGPYFDALRFAGLEPVSVYPGSPADSMEGFAGLMLCGGSDLDPALYGQKLDPRTGERDRARDTLELMLLNDALARDLPVLAICRGMQLFNVAHGGTLAQHVEGHAVRGGDRGDPVHRVTIEPGSLLARIYGAAELEVNSRHHQAASRPGEGLRISARAGEVIEGLERPELRFAVAVQWHPEDQLWRSEAQRLLFLAFASAVRAAVPGAAVPGSAVPGSAVPGSAVPGSAVPV